ncbi:MAG TPA: class I SAM-dependent methyltransferase [Clostridiaceae bacterium]|nr:class I SAM-dependent methyltransferase [Clostridiaceae bacterium]
MDIAQQFNSISREYDSVRRKFIPCFDEYYDKTTHFVTRFLGNPSRILDLGAGTGLLSSFWIKHFPNAEYVLTDIADQMLEVAKMRFSGMKNVICEVSDYTRELPKGAFDVIMSALSIHHLEDADKVVLFRRIYDKLPPGGLFINYDQFCGDTDTVGQMFDAYWIGNLESSGLSEESSG